ncbi:MULTISPECIES: carbohydrate ABC transporter permease [Pseudothermotoga]|jgi:putative chitobiose transport system permease protein|uniref:Binding-protein-dependent transport systems inner membrane component n=1 Tax=Pseudothermotoga lettingae (strain ATCC BAA-301 / DSM 14385 / NBRC 107922 / TMO) TaxID=416591 RepID=A8F3E3_PSELT|nr:MULTISPECIES: carbohydrate ABC transporter permease [Pseudothermotoga]ABV32677.1 binding-protein-dependent transport systems inner membrane component [Pseudothermotoga lettingae TMO]MDK2885287.1 putative chitobiose transport system permease protein [Pseudothermotoga sp.]MDN5338612.1 putative chitobiose transport system permease protein [Thermotogaceae bacterium]GLI48330.1 sugar ABC transporter permease [Pseudothermotoga lettingae TMO]
MRGRKILRCIFTYLILIVVALFFTFPFLWVLSTSFKGAENIFTWPPEWIPKKPTFENYKAVFERIPMIRYFLNTLIITAIGVVFQVVLASLAAYPLARLEWKGKDLIFKLILLPMLIPMQGALIVNFITIIKMGLYDSYFGVVLPGAVSIFGIFLMRQQYFSVPKEIEDAARIDGCNEFQVFWKITFPLVRPGTSALAIFAFTSYWNSLLWPLVVLRSPDKYPIQVGLAQLSSTFEPNFRTASAAMVLAMVPILIFFYFTQRFFIEGYKGAVIQ